MTAADPAFAGIQRTDRCIYNRVVYRLAAYAVGLALLLGPWIALAIGLADRSVG
jgi:hypothetical protein